MMTTEECRRQAELCLEMAAKAKTSETREAFNRVAQSWTKLANSYARGYTARIEVADTLRTSKDKTG